MVRGAPVRSGRVRRTAALVTSIIAALLLPACGGGSATRAQQQSSIAQQAGLPKDVADFFALASKAAGATYTSSITTVDSSGAPVQITTTQHPPLRRIDVFHADGSVDATIVNHDGSFQCTMTAGSWQCGDLGPTPSSSGGVLSADAVQQAVDRFRQRAADYDFRTEQRPMVGVTATCLVTTRKPGHDQDPSLGASATLCLSAEGVPLDIEVPTGSLHAVAYASTVDDGVFALPAPVSEPSTTAN